MNNDRLFKYSAELSLPDFQKQEKYVDKHWVFPPENIPVEQWYADFKARLFDALDNRKKCRFSHLVMESLVS